MNIRPSAAIRQNCNEIAALCREAGEPVHLTKNGGGDLVVMDIESFQRREKLLALRELCRNRFYLIDMGSDLKRKITALLDQVFPEFESQFSTIFGKTALAVLRQYPTPEKLSRAQTGKLTEVLQTASNGRFGEWKA